MKQFSTILFEQTTIEQLLEEKRFNGSDYDHERDGQRLGKQFERVFGLMKDGSWRSLGEIASTTGDPEASVSAQLRHARKPRFGGHTVAKRYLGSGLFEYRLVLNPSR